jgi:hypothetical protein
MAQKQRTLSKLDRALQDPSSVFADPAEVLSHPGLSREQRMLILERWEHDARELAVAEEEGMGGGEPSQLARVRRALLDLGAHSKRGSGTTKHGA